jgi:hypothetical protein
MTPRAQNWLRFTSGSYTWIWTHAPSGLNGVLEHIQLALPQYILVNLIGNICFLRRDDIIVYAATCQSLCDNLESVFERLYEYGLILDKRSCHFGFRSIEILPTFDDMFNTNDKILPSDHIDFGQLALHMDTVQSIINAGRISDTHDRDAIIIERVWLGPILSRSIHTTPGRFSLFHGNFQDFILQRPIIETILSHEWLFCTPANAELFFVVLK